jgi:predicted SAM-dependent methyltransferase
MTNLLTVDHRHWLGKLVRVPPESGSVSSRLNVGCGQTPTAGWKNYDNSPSVRLARRPITALLLRKLGMLNSRQQEFIAFTRRSEIHWADATRGIPEPDRSAEVLYSSHMLEHIDKREAMRFLGEARRVLIPGGIIRLALPNIRYFVDKYLQHHDADKFIEDTLLTRPKNRTILDKLKYLWVGDRHHLWMYDGESLCKFLSAAGFRGPQVMEPGTTTIKEPGQLNLREREPESVFVEAVNP